MNWLQYGSLCKVVFNGTRMTSMSMYEKSVESSVRSIKEGNGLSSKDIIEMSSVMLEKEHVEIQ
jgi:hypothetical protein